MKSAKTHRNAAAGKRAWPVASPILLAALTFMLSAAPAQARGGYGFRNFPDNPPRVGEKAPLPPGVDIQGKRMEMKDHVGKTHLIVVFGALT